MSGKQLLVLMNGRRCGVVTQANNRLSFAYDPAWQALKDAFPLSLSMPTAKAEHDHATISSFMWGLLPDNNITLETWGKMHHVSANNCFALLSAVGEDTSGAIQFVPPGKIDSINRSQDIEWLNQKRLEDLIEQLARNSGRTRLAATGGQFSLAGAQAKTALYRDGDRWGIPQGRRPTTHILKPLADQRDAMPENEHFCLRLADRVGMSVATSEVLSIAGIPTFCSTRYDRAKNSDGQDVRLHQEDTCQALAVHPSKKYENESGPSALQIMQLLGTVSSAANEDRDRFVRALAFNFVIGGTDAHAKNYSLVLHPGKVRLAPFYDIGSFLPYLDKKAKGTKLAMKIGGHYEMDEIMPRHWQLFARDADYDPARALAQVRDLLARLPGEALGQLHECRAAGLKAPILDQLVDALWVRAKTLAVQYGTEPRPNSTAPSSSRAWRGCAGGAR